MSVHTAMPESLKYVGRRTSVLFGWATAPLRLEPSFIVIGAQRCGTTSLFRALMAHPQVERPTFHKGINYFDLNYERGIRWYRGHFPIARIAHHNARPHGGPAAFEASGYYMYHPFALQRLGHDMPQVRLVAMLRDPVERAFSAYKHERARGFERESFEKALELEDDRLSGEIERMREDPTYKSFSHRHHSYRRRGYYDDQLERTFEFFPRENVYVIDSESYFAQPAIEYCKLLTFLDLRPFEFTYFGQYNARPSAPMSYATRRMLEEHYAPHNERLTKLLGRPLWWMR
jgi:hypothetical protein